MNKLAILTVFAAITVLAATAQAQVPHTFTAGQPARASEVNENFQALDARLSGMELALQPLSNFPSYNIIASNNAVIGRGIFHNVNSANDVISVVEINTPNGLRKAVLSLSQAGFSGYGFFYYQSPDCTGTAFLSLGSSGLEFPDILPRDEYAIDGATGDVYLAASGSGVTLEMYSRGYFGNANGPGGVACYNFSTGIVESNSVELVLVDNLYSRFPPPYSLETAP